MSKELQAIDILRNTLSNNKQLIDKITSINKEEFSKNQEYILIGISMIKEINEISNSASNIISINKKLYDLTSPICSYCSNLFNKYKLVNSYKLYDCLKFDIINLHNYLNK